MSDQSRPHSSSEPAHIAEMRHEKYRLWYYNDDYATKLSGAKTPSDPDLRISERDELGDREKPCRSLRGFERGSNHWSNAKCNAPDAGPLVGE